MDRRKHELETVQRVSQVLFHTIDLDELLETTLRTSLDEVGAESGSILLADADTEQLVFQYSFGTSPVTRGTAIPWDQGISGAVFQSGTPSITKDVPGSSRHFAGIDESTGYQTRDMITLPLKRWRGEPIGVLNVLNKREGVLDEDDLTLLTVISAFAALAIQQARLFEEAKMAEVVRFLGDIGHDLKNLLQPVVSGAWLIKGELDTVFGDPAGVDSDAARLSHEICTDSVAMIRRTCLRIHDQVKELADCVQGLSAPPRFTHCTVAGVVDDVLQTLRVLAEEQSIALHATQLDTLPPIVADERRLYSAFYNLVNNAIPEVPKGGSVTITGRTDPETNAVVVSVIDTGKGMPPEVRDRLFSARAISKKAAGTGLGTKIVKDVIDVHKGQITVESTVGSGTSFHLRLPLDPTLVGVSMPS